jgi:hypothetical protein
MGGMIIKFVLAVVKFISVILVLNYLSPNL